MRNEKYIFCYNKYLLRYLLKKGFNYVSIGQNHKTQTEYYLFERTPELTKAMDDYEAIKPRKKP